jgi:hypothetical protein
MEGEKMKEKVKEIERQWREGMPIIESDWELVFSYIFQVENDLKDQKALIPWIGELAQVKIKELEEEGGEYCRQHNLTVEQLFERIKELESKLNKPKEIDTKLVMKEVGDVLATIGIYPQSSSTWDEKTNTIKDTKLRTEWQEGWNAATMEISKKIHEVERHIGETGISDELALLLISDVGWMEEGKFVLNMNDTFWYAADAEEISEEEVKEVAGLFANYGYKGITYWVAKKRGYDPDVQRYKEQVEEVRRVEEKYKR